MLSINIFEDIKNHPHEGLKGGFIYKTVPHVTLKSIANNPDIDEIYERMHPAVEAALEGLNVVLLNLPPLQGEGRGGDGVDFEVSANAQNQPHPPPNLPLERGGTKGSKTGRGTASPLQEWTVPFDFPTDWPEAARSPFDTFHKSRQAMQKQMDASIAAHADQETLFDQPQPDKKKLRITGPFTVEDERSLFPRQVFFPLAGKGEGWQKLKKNIRAELNEDLLEQFHGTVSLPFEAGDNRKVAVKIVDDRGIESLKIIPLED